MMMVQNVIFDPLLPWTALAAGATVLGFFLVLGLWRRLPGWWLRGLAGAVVLVALANPSLQREDREPLDDIVLMVVDETASQKLSDRPDQTATAAQKLRSAVTALPNTSLREVTLRDAGGDGGTQLMTALAELAAEEPRSRIAGALLVTDGQVHDLEMTPDLPAPVHTILTGRARDWDRRLLVQNAPAFAIMGEEVTLTLRIEDQGAAPETDGLAPIEVAIDGGPAQSFRVPVGEDIALPITLPHAGMNVLQFNVPGAEGELTTRNNAAVVQINGVRDRLRVLLVSGEPYPGERTWRNLLKSDAAVDLVHFTILRPPEKQDGVPISELSLISFPTRELFLDKIDEFDLIIFDRYKRRGILPPLYLENVQRYVRQGGALLIAAGPDFASADSLYRSPLAGILPAAPTSRVIEEGFKPKLSELGARHPVTAALDAFRPDAGQGDAGTAQEPGAEGPAWGRWFRQIEMVEESGYTVMTGAGGGPLLVLDRVGQGRVALLGSDQSWLWDRGYEGGGPQLELLRRLAHWMMKEPELEEDALTLTADGQTITVERRMLEGRAETARVIAPDGEETTLNLREAEPGRFRGDFEGAAMGLYRVIEGDKEAVIALGPAAPREFEETIATSEKLAPLTEARDGGAKRIEEGIPSLRLVREGRNASGRGWIGLTPRGAYLTTDLRIIPLVSGWLFLLVAAALMLAAWLREGRR